MWETKGEGPELLEEEEGCLSLHVREGTATTNLIKKSSLTKITRLPRAVAGRGV